MICNAIRKLVMMNACRPLIESWLASAETFERASFTPPKRDCNATLESAFSRAAGMYSGRLRKMPIQIPVEAAANHD